MPTALRSGSASDCGMRAARIADILRTLGHTPLADEIATYRRVEADAALRVTVFGEYSVGKSTLINALLGEQVLAARLRPTTGVPTEVRNGAERVTVIFRDGQKRQIALDEVATYSDLDLESRANDKVDRIIVSTKSAVLRKGVVLIDTPGVLDNDRQTQRARDEVAAADIVMLVLRADHLLSAAERSLAIEWLARDLCKPVVPILNFAGLTEESGHKDLRSMLKAFTRHLKPAFKKPWYEVDALPALRYRLDVAGADMPDDDYCDLCAELESLTAGEIRKLKRQSRADWQASWHKRARETNADIRGKLERESRRLGEEREAQARRTDATIGRLGRNRKGEHARCVALIDHHKTGRRSAVTKALPAVEKLATEEERQGAIELMERSLNRALETIDERANEILMASSQDAGVVVEVVSIRELAALDVPPDTDIVEAEGGAGLKWAAILGIGATLVFSWPVAIPAAIAGLILGRWTADTSKEVAEFRQKFCDATDEQLDKLRPLLGAEFDARMDELIAALEARAATIRAMPPPEKELTLRRNLDALLA